MKRLLADVEACEMLQHVGGRLELQDDVRNDMRVFVPTKIMEVMLVYHVVRQQHLIGESKRKNKIKSLPPHENSLNHHNIEITNYLSFCQINFKMKNNHHHWDMDGSYKMDCVDQFGTSVLLYHILVLAQALQTDSTTENISSDDDSSEC